VTQISPRHPRYRSLVRREGLAKAFREGIVVPEGLLAHGRGEAFDYLLGERSSPSALRAARIAADWLSRARHPVLSVNGNVAALATQEIAALKAALDLDFDPISDLRAGAGYRRVALKNLLRRFHIETALSGVKTRAVEYAAP